MNRMTLKEKSANSICLALCRSAREKVFPKNSRRARRFAAGTYTDEIGPGSGFFTLADTILHEGTEQQQVAYFNALQKIALTQTRLKIPLSRTKKAHGAMFPGATLFPEGLPSAAVSTCL
jgi:hypothetical protein